MATVTRRYRWNAANLFAIQNNGDPGSVLPALGYTAHVDVTFDDAISDAVVVDVQMQLLGFVFETVAPVGTPLFNILTAMRMAGYSTDPAAEPNQLMLYPKDDAGITQLFARSDDGVIHQITPSLRTARGVVQGTTGNIISGAGFSVVRNGTGDYTVTFVPALASIPGLGTTIVENTNGCIRAANLAATGFDLFTFDAAGTTAADLDWSFVAVQS
jgi:hypothetical protein